MKWITRWAVFVLTLFLLEMNDMSNQAISFEGTQIGATLEGWTSTLTGSGEPKWTVESDPTAPSKLTVLRQSGRATYPLILKNDTNIRDGFVEMKFKAIAGSEDRRPALFGGRETRIITMWSRPMRLRTMSFSTRRSRACAVRSTLSAARAVMGLRLPYLPTPGTVCVSTSRPRASAYPSTAGNCLRSRIPRSPTPERWAYGPRPTA